MPGPAEFVSGGDLVLHNGHVYTLEPAKPEVDAVVIRGGRIVFLGETPVALAHAGDAAVVDLQGRTALPGFIDSHVHFWRTGLMDQMIDLTGARSIRDMQEAIAAAARHVPEGGLVMGRGWTDTTIAEHRYPTRWELDEVAPRHVVYLLHRNGHSCALNTRALEFLDLDLSRPGIDRDPQTGAPLGPLREKIAHEMQPRLLTLMDPTIRSRCLELAAQQAIEGGVTGVHCLEGGRLVGDPDVKDFLAHQSELPVSTLLYYQITNLPRILSLGLPRIGGCVLIDGSPAAHTGALYEPYSDRPDTSGPAEYIPQPELDDWVLRSHQAGLQVVVHATCERAIGQMLLAYERAIVQYPRAGHRHRIDHFYFPKREQVWKAGELGVMAGVQPYFAEVFHDMYRLRLGPERMTRVHPYRWFRDAGVIVGGGSDSFVTPIRPLWGIHAAVNHFNPEQRLTVPEAVEMFTRHSAHVGFEENEAGSLQVGKRGDIVVLSDDVFRTDPDRIRDVSVELTVSRGRVVYQA
jgi:predicted amidohydrolase YtcJ